ncbi:gypsy type transposase [Tanacetum coccineum]
MHERPAGKIRLYTRFFDYANFRLPLSTFLVDILRHFRINISQLSVIGEAKVSHFEILCRVYGIIPTVGLFRCFYVNSKKNGWMSFSKRSDNAPVSLFSWHIAKNVTRGPALIAADFNAPDYATLVAHPSPFWKFPEAFLCLVRLSSYYPLDEETYPWFLHKNGEDMDIFAFIHTPDPTKVKIIERERNEDEPLLLQTTVGRTVPLLPVAPDRAESELEASVDRLFDKGGSDAGEASHPPKRLRGDHGTPSGPSVVGKSRSTVQRLLAGAVLNPDVGVAAMPTLPFITSFVSATPEQEGGDHTDSVTGLNLHTIGASQRFVISSDSSHHSDTNVAEAEVDSLIRSSVLVMTTVTTVTSMVDPAVVAKEKPVEPSFDFLIGGIHTVIDPDTDLQKTYVPRWSVTNGSCLDDGRVYREMVDEFAPPKFFASLRGMEHDQLFTEFNIGAARQISLSAEVRMCIEYNIKEKRRLKFVVDEQAELLKVREGEIKNLKAHLLLKEAEAAEVIRLRAKASKFEAVEKSLQDEMKALPKRNTTLEKEKNDLSVKVTDLAASIAVRECEVADLDTLVTSVKSQNDKLVDRVHELEVYSSGLQEKVTMYEDCMGQLEKFQDDRMKEVNDKFDKLYANFIEMALYLEDRFYPHILTTIFGLRWLLTYGMELTITKCLNYPEYLSALGAAIGKAIEKGMQDGLSAGITHDTEGRALTDVAAYNPSAEADYISALQQLQNVNFSLHVELRSNKDASIDTLMNILRLEETLADRLGLTESQPHVDQLMVPIHHSSEKVVRSVLHDVFVPLFEPLSAAVLTGTKSTSNTVPATADTTTALSTTFASTSTIAPIFVDDYAKLWVRMTRRVLMIIENGNSFKPAARVTTNAYGTSTSTTLGAVTAKERIQKKNDVKARSILMMALLNEHLLTFNKYKDAKTLFEAIEARFGGNDTTKKTQKTLLKQTYENFNALSSESLHSISNRPQKLVSQLSILGENISQEDLNLKFLRSLPAEWDTHVIVEQEVKRSGSSSSNSGSKNMTFVSTPGSTNEDIAYVQVSTASTPVSDASTNDNAASLSDATVYAFLANQPSGSQFFYQRTWKKITINGSDTAGFDKTKVECFNCHKLGHFARECRNPRSQESRPRSYDQGSRSQDNLRRTVKIEDTSSKAMVAIDGAGFDWSYMTEEEVPTNMAHMAFSDSVEFNKSEFDLANYKRGLASVEEQLVFYKKNEVMFTDQTAVLKRDASFNESEIIALKIQIEKLKR